MKGFCARLTLSPGHVLHELLELGDFGDERSHPMQVGHEAENEHQRDEPQNKGENGDDEDALELRVHRGHGC